MLVADLDPAKVFVLLLYFVIALAMCFLQEHIAMIANTSLSASGTSDIDAILGKTKATTLSHQAASGSDTVQLSQTAQVTVLHHQGMSAKQIAANLGMTMRQVDSYLGITTANSTAPVVVAFPSNKNSSASGNSACTVV